LELESKNKYKNFEKILLTKYRLAADKTLKNFDLIKYSQSEIIYKLQQSIKEQSIIISKESTQIID
jgi:hypothetical protein